MAERKPQLKVRTVLFHPNILLNILKPQPRGSFKTPVDYVVILTSYSLIILVCSSPFRLLVLGYLIEIWFSAFREALSILIQVLSALHITHARNCKDFLKIIIVKIVAPMQSKTIKKIVAIVKKFASCSYGR